MLHLGTASCYHATVKAETLAQYLTRVMKERNLSASDVERRSATEITDGYVNLVASGKQTNITIAKLVSLAKGMGDNPHNLLDVFMGEPAPQSTDPWPSHMFLNAMKRMVN